METVKREKYICIQEFMVRDLKLKGNELIVYALLYGFTQDGEQYFSGSLSYIANWINASKTTAQNVIKSLMEKGFLIKKDKYVNNVKFCEYTTTIPENGNAQTEKLDAIPNSDMGCTENRYEGIPNSGTGHTKNWYGGIPNSGTGHTKNWYEGIPNSGTNNNIYNTNNNLDNKYILSGTPDDVSNCAPDYVPKKPKKPKLTKHPEEVKQIVEYFNRVCGTNYKYQSESTASMINARLNDGFTVDDFYKVIDKKYAEWNNDSYWCKYLRPQTLFRPSHFESYLNQRSTPAGENIGGITQEMAELYEAVVIR